MSIADKKKVSRRDLESFMVNLLTFKTGLRIKKQVLN